MKTDRGQSVLRIVVGHRSLGTVDGVGGDGDRRTMGSESDRTRGSAGGSAACAPRLPSTDVEADIPIPDSDPDDRRGTVAPWRGLWEVMATTGKHIGRAVGTRCRRKMICTRPQGGTSWDWEAHSGAARPHRALAGRQRAAPSGSGEGRCGGRHAGEADRARLASGAVGPEAAYQASAAPDDARIRPAVRARAAFRTAIGLPV